MDHTSLVYQHLVFPLDDPALRTKPLTRITSLPPEVYRLRHFQAYPNPGSGDVGSMTAIRASVRKAAVSGFYMVLCVFDMSRCI